LPRLPEGTRVGKLVMGKYGLYHPGVRKSQIEFYEGIEINHDWSENARPFDRRVKMIGFILFITVRLAFA
jgi:hypothetical protein